MHWAAAYVGLPWCSGAGGPDAYDCWGLVRAIQSVHYGRDLPLLDADAARLPSCARTAVAERDSGRWRPAEVPNDGDCALMGYGQRPHHAGVWLAIDGGRVLHAVEVAGVVCVDAAGLTRSGWRVLGWYRWAI